MKLVIAMVQDRDAPSVVAALLEQGFSTTKLASTGGFLREGNTTLLVGVQDGDVERVLAIIRSRSRSRKQLVSPVPQVVAGETCVPCPVEVTVGGMTAFVVDVDRFEKA